MGKNIFTKLEESRIDRSAYAEIGIGYDGISIPTEKEIREMKISMDTEHYGLTKKEDEMFFNSCLLTLHCIEKITKEYVKTNPIIKVGDDEVYREMLAHLTMFMDRYRLFRSTIKSNEKRFDTPNETLLKAIFGECGELPLDYKTVDDLYLLVGSEIDRIDNESPY